MPFNLHVGGRELPVGLLLITTMLFLLAAANLLTKESATLGGLSFTGLLYLLLTVSERRSAKSHDESRRPAEQFRLQSRESLSSETLCVRPGGIVVGVHDPDQLAHVNALLEHNDPGRQDVILVAVHGGQQIGANKPGWREMGEGRSVRVDILPDRGQEATRIDLKPADAIHG